MIDTNGNLETSGESIDVGEDEADMLNEAMFSAERLMETALDRVTKKLFNHGCRPLWDAPELLDAVITASAVIYLADRIGLLADEVRVGLGGISEAIRGNHDRKGQS